MTVRDAIVRLKDSLDAMLVGVFADDGCEVNPPGDHALVATNELLVIRSRPLNGSAK